MMKSIILLLAVSALAFANDITAKFASGRKLQGGGEYEGGGGEYEGEYEGEKPQVQCTPNRAGTGLVCQNITVYTVDVGGQPMRLSLDWTSTYDPDGSEFRYQVSAFRTSRRGERKRIDMWEFTSSTPNGTVLDVDRDQVRNVQLPTGLDTIQNISVNIVARYNISVYWTADKSGCPMEEGNGTSSGTHCNSGWLEAIVGLRGGGQRPYRTTRIILQLDEPNAVTYQAPFVFYVDRSELCGKLEQNLVFDQNMTLETQMCERGACTMNETKLTVMSPMPELLVDQCTNHSMTPEYE